MWYLQQLRPSLEQSTSWRNRQYTFRSYSKKWVTNNLPHQSKRTIQQPKGSSTAKSNPNEPRQWTCNSTGYVIARPRNNFDSFGKQENRTLPITRRNTIRQWPQKHAEQVFDTKESIEWNAPENSEGRNLLFVVVLRYTQNHGKHEALARVCKSHCDWG